ncbi:TetR/AcrR family transcriptional regulator [Amycolatopsis antarctica]|nr:TetR/AcrR family transcriptional regulator [Amycolatopsis antarctica]
MDASAELFRRNGYTGTGLKQIVAAASAPFGSIYHFFPGGKVQLGEEVIRSSGAMYELLFQAILDPAPDLITGVETIFSSAAETLRETDYADACPIATIALEVASTNEALRRATADVFDSWIATGAERFREWGLDEATSRRLTIALLTSLEGAFVLSRAQRNTEALEVAGATIVEAVRAAVDAGGGSGNGSGDAAGG